MPFIAKPKFLFWTKHVRKKMRFYKLSEQRVRRVLNSPMRTEEGIAPNTIAVMQSAGNKKHPYEIWVMAQCSKTVKIISAWKYPGRTKPRDEISFGFIQREYAECKGGN